MDDDIKAMFDTNVLGLVNMTQEVLKIYKKRDEGGRGDIINIGSIAGREPYPGGSIYCATKAATRTFTDALRRELIATRIRVMEIDPGQVETVRRFWIRFPALADPDRNSQLYDSMVTKPKQMPSMRGCSSHNLIPRGLLFLAVSTPLLQRISPRLLFL